MAAPDEWATKKRELPPDLLCKRGQIVGCWTIPCGGLAGGDWGCYEFKAALFKPVGHVAKWFHQHHQSDQRAADLAYPYNFRRRRLAD